MGSKIFEPISAKFFAKFLTKKGPKIFGGLNQKSESISMWGSQSSNSWKNNHRKILMVVEVIRRLVTVTLEKARIKIWPFNFILLLKSLMVIFGPVDF